jgi:HNH endonuclease
MTYAIENNLSLPELQELFQMHGSDVVWKKSRHQKIKVDQLAGALLRVKNKKYRMVRVLCKNGYKGFILAHVISFALHNGKWPNTIVDHKDGDGLNNAPSNLREASFSQNTCNAQRPSTNTTGVKGVCFIQDGRAKPYRAQLRMRRKHVLDRYFATLEEAKAAVQEARTKHHGEFAHHD